MAKNDDRVHVEISDVYDPEQEKRVIEAVGGLVKKSPEELSSYFTETDTLLVKKVSTEEAERLAQRLEGADITVRIIEPGARGEEEEKEGKVRCPACGYVMEFADWRCPECYHEFPDFPLSGDE